MNRTAILILVIAAASAAAGYFSARQLQTDPATLIPQAAETGVGLPLPVLEGQALNGDIARLSGFKGRRILLNFWATWCAPCRREMPDLMAIRAELDSRQSEVVGVALDFPEAVQAYVSELGIEYPILIPDDLAGSRMLRQLGNANGLLPFSVLVDAEGVVEEVHLGELTREQARDLITGAR
jgi:peroxiredoxin